MHLSRTLPLLAAMAAVIAVPLVSAESWSTISVQQQTWTNGSNSVWNYASAGAAWSAGGTWSFGGTFSMPAMPQMPAMPNHAMTMAAKIRECRKTYVTKVPFVIQTPNGTITRQRTQVNGPALRDCLRAAVGNGGASWSWPTMSAPSMSSVSSSRSSSVSSASAVSHSSSSLSSSTSVQANHVTIQGFAFQPALLHVKKGTTVTWTNQDNVAHTVTGDIGGPASGLLQKGQSYSYTFGAVGAYPYFCQPHPRMRGTVIVTQ